MRGATYMKTVKVKRGGKIRRGQERRGEEGRGERVAGHT